MSKKIIVMDVQDGAASEGVDVASKIRLTITPGVAKHLLRVVSSRIMSIGDHMEVSIGAFDALSDEDEEIDLDWRPTSAYAVLHGGMSNLDNFTVSVGCRDCDGEYMFGTFPLSHAEIEEIAKEDDTEGTYRVWVETTIIRDAQIISGKAGEIQANGEDADHDLGMSLHDAAEVECDSVVCMKRLSAAEVAELSGVAA